MYNRHALNIMKHKNNIKEGEGLSGMCMGSGIYGCDML